MSDTMDKKPTTPDEQLKAIQNCYATIAKLNEKRVGIIDQANKDVRAIDVDLSLYDHQLQTLLLG